MRLTLRFKGGKGSGNFNHSGRPGKVGGSSSDIYSAIKQSDFFDTNANTSELVAEKAGKLTAYNWNVSQKAIDALANTEGFDINKYTLQQKKAITAELLFRLWNGSSGGDAAMYAIKAVADKQKRKYDLYDSQKQVSDWIDNNAPLEKEALSSLGEAIYQNTQKWFADRGIKKIKVMRSGSANKNRLFSSWSISHGGVRWESNLQYNEEIVNAADVFSIPPTGFGNAAESEIVLLPR